MSPGTLNFSESQVAMSSSPSSTQYCFEWNIKVRSPIKHQDDHVDYCVVVTNKEGKTWTSRKRYREFRSLFDDLSSRHPVVQEWPFPPKVLFHTEKVMHDRIVPLQDFLHKCTHTRATAADRALIQFLGSPPASASTAKDGGGLSPLVIVVAVAVLVVGIIPFLFKILSMLVAILLAASVVGFFTKPTEASFYEYLRVCISGPKASWFRYYVYAPLALTIMDTRLEKMDIGVARIVIAELEEQNVLIFIGAFNSWIHFPSPF